MASDRPCQVRVGGPADARSSALARPDSVETVGRSTHRRGTRRPRGRLANASAGARSQARPVHVSLGLAEGDRSPPTSGWSTEWNKAHPDHPGRPTSRAAGTTSTTSSSPPSRAATRRTSSPTLPGASSGFASAGLPRRPVRQAARRAEERHPARRPGTPHLDDGKGNRGVYGVPFLQESADHHRQQAAARRGRASPSPPPNTPGPGTSSPQIARSSPTSGAVTAWPGR